ncbi:hypothetical protein LTR86_009604 [Recurvomyces mirabilis]|nr:hypothetical protein LTR86_009604 [Recurvomyces mirabilis]
MSGTKRLYVGNLPYVAQKADVADFFAKNNVEVLNIDISIDSFTGRNPSYCFVDFGTEEAASQARQTLQGQLIRGRPIKINIDTGNRHHPRGPRTEGGPLPPDNRYVYDRWTRTDAPDHWLGPQTGNPRDDAGVVFGVGD